MVSVFICDPMFVVKGNRLSKLPLVARRVLAIPSMTGRELLDALHSEDPQLADFDVGSPGAGCPLTRF